METDESINADSFTSEAMNQQENIKNGIGYALYDGNYYLYDIDNDGMARPVKNIGTSLDDAKKKKLKKYAMEREQLLDEFITAMNEIEMDTTGQSIIWMIVRQKESHVLSLINWLEESKETDFNTIVRKAVEITKD